MSRIHKSPEQTFFKVSLKPTLLNIPVTQNLFPGFAKSTSSSYIYICGVPLQGRQMAFLPYLLVGLGGAQETVDVRLSVSRGMCAS